MIPAFAGMTLFLVVTAFAQDDEALPDDAMKAKRAHDMAASDVIYQQEDFRALYYQNEQMISLLKEMRDTLRQIREQGAKTDAKTEEKS